MYFYCRSLKFMGTICITLLDELDSHQSILYKTVVLLSRKKASTFITFFAQTLQCNTKITFEFLKPNIFTIFFSKVTFASVNPLKKTLYLTLLSRQRARLSSRFSRLLQLFAQTPQSKQNIVPLGQEKVSNSPPSSSS